MDKEANSAQDYDANSVGAFDNENEENESDAMYDTTADRIIDVAGHARSDEREHMLPVHFLPEGKKCYDWINEDLANEKEHQPQVTNLTTFENESTIFKNQSTSINSVTYHAANISSDVADDVQKGAVVQRLLSAAEHCKLDELKEILHTHPLYVNCFDGDRYTPLHRACYSGHESIVLYLLEHGASVHSRTSDGWQPLHCASRWNQTNVCKILLAKHADVNAMTNGCQTPLHFAALSNDSRKILEMFLLQPNIDATIMNAAGDTPYDLAVRNGEQYKMFEMVDEELAI